MDIKMTIYITIVISTITEQKYEYINKIFFSKNMPKEVYLNNNKSINYNNNNVIALNKIGSYIIEII